MKTYTQDSYNFDSHINRHTWKHLQIVNSKCTWTCLYPSMEALEVESVLAEQRKHFRGEKTWENWRKHLSMSSPPPALSTPTYLFMWRILRKLWGGIDQWCINRVTCSHPELTQDHVLTSAYIRIFLTVATNGVNESVWRKQDCSWLPSTNMQWISLLKHQQM